MLRRSIGMAGGIRRDIANWSSAPGHWTVSGLHGNVLNKLQKVRGSSLFSPTGLGARVTGLYQTRLASNTYYLAMAGGAIYSVTFGGPATLTSGLSPAPYDAKVFGDLIILASGINANKKILSDLTVSNVGIAAPTTAPTAADGGAGPLTGSYFYKRTFKNSRTGHESDPSPSSSPGVSVTAKQIQVSGLGGATDPQVDRQVLYRTVAGGVIWLRVVELPIGDTSFMDTVADSALAEEVLEDNGVPPIASFLELYNGMMLYLGQQAPHQNRLSISAVGRPEAVDPDNDQDLDPEEDDTITGCKRFGQAVAIHKRNGIYLASGLTPDTLTVVRTRVTNGSISHWGIIEHEGAHWYPSEKGPHVFSGLKEQYFGRPIEDIWRTLDLSAMSQCSGVYDRDSNSLIWTAKRSGAADFDMWLIYNIETKEWTTREFASSRISTYLDGGKRSRLFLGGVDGNISTGNVGTSDNGTNINVEYVSRGIGLEGKEQYDKTWLYAFRHLEIDYEPNGGTKPVTVNYSIDSENGPWKPAVNAKTGETTFVPTTGTQARFNLPDDAQGRLIFVRLQESSTDSLTITGITAHGARLRRF